MCNCKFNCTALAVLISIVIGIITAFLTFSAVITVAPAFLWALFGIAVVFLGGTLALSVISGGRSLRCICYALPLLLTGILGTILTSVILLGITFAATSVIGAIITGLLLLFFALTVTTTACLIACISDCDNN